MPERQRNLYQYVRSGRLVFLLDVSQDQLVGIFETMSDIGMHLEMGAWGGRLPLQVRVRPLGSPIVVRHISSLWASVGVPTKIFSGRVVPEKKHLDRAITQKLCELFKSKS